MQARFNADGLLLEDNTLVPLYAGEFHYWRCEASLWPKALRALKELGLEIVSTYVPWSVHEVEKGVFDFRGKKDLGAFLDQVSDLGLHALVRPGPHVNAELTHFGFPERVLANKEVQARSATGAPVWLPAPPKMFPLPSYASAVFQDEVGLWFEAVAAVVADRAHPKGPVLAIQVDNEMQGFWRLAPFESDYHPEALAWWREYSEGEPAPTAYSEEAMPQVLQWLRFKEHYQARSLQWLKQALDNAGLGALPRYHNLPPTKPSLANLPAAEDAIEGVAGMDFYDVRSGYTRVRERALYLASSTSLAFAPELGLGGPPWFPTMDEEDQKNVLLGCLAGGVRAFNLYMAVQRERWYGGLLDREGSPNACAEWIAPLLQTLRTVGFHSLRRHAPIALIVSRAEERAAIASCALDDATPVVTELLGLGPSGHAELALDESARGHARWMRAIQDALDFAELPYQLIDESSLHRLDAATKAVVMPTLRRVDGATWAALHALSATGMQIVLGPLQPTHDELDAPLGPDGDLPAGAGLLAPESLDDLEGLADDLLGLAGTLEDLWIAPSHSFVQCSAYGDASGATKLLFVGNASNAEQLAQINVPDACVLSDAMSAEEHTESDGVVQLVLAPHQVRCFVVG